MFRSFFVVMLCSAWVLPLAAHAQVNPFRSSRVGSGLNQDDLKALGAASQRLYTQNSVADGTSDTWSNPRSGNSGTVTVLQSFERQGNACRKLRYDIRLRQRKNPSSYTLSWCHLPDGSWKVI